MCQISPIIRAFLANTERSPEKDALRINEYVISYNDLKIKAGKLSGYFKKLGIKKEDRVAVLLPNSIEFVLVMLAAADLGLTCVPQNQTLPTNTLFRSFLAADVKHLIAHHSLLPDIKKLAGSFFSNDSAIISVGKELNSFSYFDDYTQIEHVLGKNEVSPDTPYILSLTSGSTGEPKPIILSQECKIKRALAAKDLYKVKSCDIIMAATPLYHSLAERLVLMPLILGATAVILPGFTPTLWLRAIENHKVTFTIAVSSQIKSIFEEISKQNYCLDSLRCLVSSSARLDSDIKLKLLNFLSCDFHECYGTSEIAIASNLTKKDGFIKTDSVGKPAPGTEILIINEKNEILPALKKGEICCKTPMVFSGYYKQPETTKKSFFGKYFKTGDAGYIDSDGYLYYSGRIKDIIITGGINVYPKDIEDVILTHPAVEECVALALPDTKLVEIIAVALKIKEGSILTGRELQRLSAKHLADYQQPMKYICVEQIPKNPMGKTDKKELLRRITEEDYGVIL